MLILIIFQWFCTLWLISTPGFLCKHLLLFVLAENLGKVTWIMLFHLNFINAYEWRLDEEVFHWHSYHIFLYLLITVRTKFEMNQPIVRKLSMEWIVFITTDQYQSSSCSLYLIRYQHANITLLDYRQIIKGNNQFIRIVMTELKLLHLCIYRLF